MLFRKKNKVKKPLFRRIINYFLGAGIGLIVIILVAFGYTQTSSFRSWLKEFAIEQVNSSTNGKLAIGNLDGTVLTSLILSNVSFTLYEDTLFSAEKIELKVSPLRVFLKTIYIRKLEIENASISLIKDKDGELNISKITAPEDEEAEEIKDTITTSEPFNWKIVVAQLNLKNVNFIHQSLSNRGSTKEYPQPEMDDFRLQNINLSLSAAINMSSNEYLLNISEFSFKPNLEGFKLLNLSGNFILLEDMAGIKEFKIITERSFISLNAALSDFYLFSESGIKLEQSPIKLELRAMNFDFDDLTNFIEGTDILKGSVETHVIAEGSLADLELKSLEVKLNETSLNASGFIQNVLDGDEMLINFHFKDSFINQDDVINLLPSIGIPTYKEYGMLRFDSLAFEGKPLDFKANLFLQTDKGTISGLVQMDLTGEEIDYKYKIKTSQLNLMPITGLNTNLNLSGNFTGKGFSPETLETSIRINAGSSGIEGIFFSDFIIAAEASKGIINTDVAFSSLETQGKLIAEFDFTDTAISKYNFDAVLLGFNIEDFVKESEINSELNLSLKGDGENFDQDKLNLFAVLEIDSSRINDIRIDSTVLIADIRSSEENRIINIISDLADLTIKGDFTLLEFIDVVSEEAEMLSVLIQNKIEQIQLPDFSKPDSEKKSNLVISRKQPAVPFNRNLNVQYLLELKSFDLLSLFIGNAEIEVDGEITGKLSASGDTTIVSLDTKINQMKYWDGLELYYLSGFNFNFKMNNRSSADSFDYFKADMNVNANRVFIGSLINNLDFNLHVNGNNAQVDLAAVYQENVNVNLGCSLFINDGYVDVLFDRMLFEYYSFDLVNSGDLRLRYSNDGFTFNSFSLSHNGGLLDLDGQLSFTGSEDLSLKLKNFRVKDLSTTLLGLPADRSFDGELNLNFLLTGTADNPVISLNYSIDSVKVESIYLGAFESEIQYSDKLLKFDLKFLESKTDKRRESLVFNGILPIDLAFYSEERLIKDEEVSLNLLADKFDIRFATGLLPGVRNLKGILNGNISLTGEYDKLFTQGELTIGNSSFILKANNLTYFLDSKILFENDRIVLSNLNIKNGPNIKDGGSITARGEFILRNFEIISTKLNASGALKLLDGRTRAADPSLIGDITVRTRDDIVFTSTEDRSYIKADLILSKGANLVYSPTQSAFTNENDKFNYVFISTNEEDLLKKEIDSLIQVAENRKEEIQTKTKIPFDLDLKIAVESEAKVVFVLSREFKQNLTAYLGGRLEYSVTNEIPSVGGELTLLDGSKLDFIKTFQAKGNIKFIDELDNPYVDVTAIYESIYSPDTVRTATNEWDIQIVIKLEGPAKRITTNFLQDESNITVYKSRRNANQFELDASKTASDAMFFIIVNKFPEDATLQESNFAASTAAALAGSIVGSVLNEKLGDVVRSVNVQQLGTETVFSLIGRVGNFRYEIGGTSQVFQDFSRANVKIEHPLFLPNFIIKFDRREPPYQSSTYSEMINELGLKYSFIF